MNGGTRSLFTVEDANQLLPLLRSIARDVVEDFRCLRAAGRRRRSQESLGAPTQEDARRLQELREEVAACSSRIERYLSELALLGVEARDLELGLVDFPTLIDGVPAYLSWRLGEERVSWWHPADRGFTDRAPVGEAALRPS